MAIITTLINNTAAKDLESEHGLSFWIEYNGKHVLFDTGQTRAITDNASKMGVDLADTDVTILSHGHYDHTGGIPSVFALAKRASIYMHPKAIDAKYSRKPGRAKAIGMPKAAREVVNSMAAKGKAVATKLPSEIFPGLFVTGTIPRKTSFEITDGNFFLDEICTVPDGMLDDQAVFFKAQDGLVVLLGCAHAGVVNTLDYIVSLADEKEIHAVIGGMHLSHSSSRRIDCTIEAIKKYDVREIGLAHCTGTNVMQKLRDAFGDRCFECSAGTRKNFNL